MSLTVSASSGTTTRVFFPSFPFTDSYPRSFGRRNLPLAKRHSRESCMASLFMWLSSSATIARTNRIRLLAWSSVFRLTSSKMTAIGGLCSWSLRTQPMQSRRFLANRDTDFVMIASIFPAIASFIIFRKPGLCAVLVPEKPSSTYVPKYSQFGFSFIFFRYSFFCISMEMTWPTSSVETRQ